MSSLSSWLKGIGLDRYVPAFEQHDIDFETLNLLNERDLKSLGVSLGHRKRLLKAIGDLKRTDSGSGATIFQSGQQPLVTEAERRQLTVLFCDLVGSTELSSSMDPEPLRRILLEYEEVCTAAINSFDGYVFQRQGDGIIAYFGFPIAYEDAPERAIRAGIKILESVPQLKLTDSGPLSVRVGISTGLVVVSDLRSADHSAVGDAMNLAARLQTLAQPGSIVISDMTRHLAGGCFEYEDLGSQSLKGFPHLVHVWRVLGHSLLGGRFEAATRGGLSPLVGRKRELATLLQRWQLVDRGEGQAVIVSGEPGVGKSRLLRALRDQLGIRAAGVLRFQCSSLFSTSTLYPIIDYLERELGLASGEPSASKLERLEAMMIGQYGRPPRDVSLLASMLTISTAGRYERLSMAPQRQKEETIRALIDLMEAFTRTGPTLVLFEDIHWADPTTLEALDLLIARLRRFQLFLLITHRPDTTRIWKLNREDHVASLPVSRLTAAQSTRLVTDLAGKQLPPNVVKQIVAKTDGIPLYVEELTKTLLESDANELHRGYPDAIPSTSIPSTLRDSLMARLDRLMQVKEVAQVGSVLGREFSFEMLHAVLPMSQLELDRALQQLTDSGLVVRRGIAESAVFTFKHALVQETAYESLLKSSRQQWHKKIALVMHDRFPAIRDSRPELLAFHYTEAGFSEAAVPLWCQAGKNAIARSGNLEAIAHLGRGLEEIRSLAPQPERHHQELVLQTLLGNALMATKGYGAPEVGLTFDRARTLCERLGDTPQSFPVLRGLWMFYLVRGELKTARELADQVLDLAERAQETSMLLEAHRTMGMTRFFSADFPAARRHLEKGIALYNLDKHRELAFLYQTDPGVGCLCYVAATLWILGFPDQAIKRLHDGLELAEKCGHAFTRSFALYFSAVLHQFRCESSAAQKQAELDIAFCKEGGFVLWLSMALVVRGWARVEQGRKREGLAEIHDGLKAYRATGAGLARTYVASLLADASRKAGHLEEGLSALNEALVAAESMGERLFEAELYRLKAELMLQVVRNKCRRVSACASVGVREEAEKSISRAIDVARAQGAKSLELRAIMTLCRMWVAAGKHEEARLRLGDAYASFTEGFATPDLVNARNLLKALGNGESLPDSGV